MPKKTSSSGSKKSRSDTYKSGDGAPKRTKGSGDKEKKKSSRSKPKVKIEADEEKTIWYQDRCAEPARLRQCVQAGLSCRDFAAADVMPCAGRKRARRISRRSGTCTCLANFRPSLAGGA